MQRDLSSLRKRAVCAALVCAGLSLTCPQAWSLDANVARPIDVAIHGDCITVLAHDAPVRIILEELAHQLNLVVEAHAPLDEYISLEIRGEPPPTVMRRLLRDYSFTLQYFPVTDAGVAAQRPGRLWIHPQNEQNSGEVAIIARFGVTQTDDTNSAIGRIASAKPAVRLDSVAVLTAFGGDEAFVTLSAAMNDPDPAVREEAVVGIGSNHSATSLHLLQQALADTNPHVRRAAIDALSDTGSENAALLLGPLLQDAETSLRTDAVHALGEIGGPAAGTLLQQALSDEHSSVREAAADYLAELSHPRAEPVNRLATKAGEKSISVVQRQIAADR